MPLFDFLCLDCGQTSELLITGKDDPALCQACGSKKVKKMLSAHSSISGTARHSMPGSGDTTCCGSVPHSAGCAGPGSCCGKNSA